MMNFGSMFGPMMGALGSAPRPNPMPAQIGSAIQGIFGNTPKPTGMLAQPMQLPNYGGGARPMAPTLGGGGARPIAGITPMSTPQFGHAGWLARGKKPR